MILTAALGGLLFVFLFASASYQVSGLTVRADLGPALSGESVLGLPPLGELRAKTHSIPVSLRLTVDRINLNELSDIAFSGQPAEEVLDALDQAARLAALKYLALVLTISGVGGFVAVTLLRPSWEQRAAGFLAGTLAAAALMLPMAVTYDAEAFAEPTYTGALTAAPWLIDSAQEGIEGLKGLRRQMRAISAGATRLHSQTEAWNSDTPDEEGASIMVVGDIHNNPAGIDLVARAAADLKVDAVVDVGDISDWGTPFEAGLAQRVEGVGLDYIYVPGNHDSPDMLDRLRALANVTVVDNGLVDVAGIRIYGLADPAAYMMEPEPVSEQNLEDVIRAAKPEILKARPDVVAVHNPIAAQMVNGLAPTVIFGHTHRSSVSTQGSVLLNPGSAGAAGVRNLGSPDPVPYSLMVLRFGPDGRAFAVDQISLSDLGDEFVLARRRLESPDSHRSALKP